MALEIMMPTNVISFVKNIGKIVIWNEMTFLMAWWKMSSSLLVPIIEDWLKLLNKVMKNAYDNILVVILRWIMPNKRRYLMKLCKCHKTQSKRATTANVQKLSIRHPLSMVQISCSNTLLRRFEASMKTLATWSPTRFCLLYHMHDYSPSKMLNNDKDYKCQHHLIPMLLGQHLELIWSFISLHNSSKTTMTLSITLAIWCSYMHKNLWGKCAIISYHLACISSCLVASTFSTLCDCTMMENNGGYFSLSISKACWSKLCWLLGTIKIKHL